MLNFNSGYCKEKRKILRLRSKGASSAKEIAEIDRKATKKIIMSWRSSLLFLIEKVHIYVN